MRTTPNSLAVPAHLGSLVCNWYGRLRRHSTRPSFALALCLALMAGGTLTGDALAQDVNVVDAKLEQRIPGSAPMPRTVASIDPTRPPTFVAANRVLLADGSVDPSMFRPGEVEMIERHLAQAPSDGCIRMDLFSSDHLPSNGGRPPVGEMIRRSENAVVAEVTGQIYGYMSFEPGTLLRVETQEVLLGGSYREIFLIHFPVGSFEIGAHRICRTTVGFPSPPAIGDRVLLLYNDIEYSDATEFLNVRATDVVVLPKSGAARFSTYLTSDLAKSGPVNSAQFLDFARSQLTQDSPEDIE